MPELYPVFDIPETLPDEIEDNEVYRPTPLFDFEVGDFIRDGANRVIMVDGREAYRQWVLKMLNTPYGACRAYPMLGLDHEGAMAEIDRSAVEATFERVITECLLQHPMTERIREFEYSWASDELAVNFTVQGKDLPSIPVRFLARR